MKQIGILGAGTWGVTLARLLANKGNQVTVWSALPSEVSELSATHRHKNLPDMLIPESIIFTEDISAACLNMDVIVFAVPSVYMRATAHRAKPFVADEQIIVSVAKGFENDTLLTMTQIIESEVGKRDRIVALSGPTHAEEVSVDMPTMIVAACEKLETAQVVQELFATDFMRVYSNTDIYGVELCGALKNVMALAAGISEGLGYGDNAKAALITRGIAEMSRLGEAIGCNIRTFAGLAGIGDLIVTATSHHSRNNQAGILLGKGYSAKDAIEKVGMVVEGLNALGGAMKLADKYKVEMPIVQAIDSIVNKGADPREIVGQLMGREQKVEF